MRKLNLLRSTLKVILLLCFLLPIVVGCRKDAPPIENQGVVNLRWIQSYPGETIDSAVLGLKWALSHIGAKIFNSAGIKVSQNNIQVNIDFLGFSAQTIMQLQLLNNQFKLTESYEHFKSADLGRYVTCLIGASEHYYAFVNQPKKLEDLIAQYSLSAQAGFVNESSVSPKNRIIRFSGQEGLKQLFIAEEVDKITGELLEFETVDIMENGDLRFGIYDLDGNILNSADATVSNAGKPAKCIWCHESNIQPLFADQGNYPNYLSFLEFGDTLEYFRTRLKLSRQGLVNGIDFSDKTSHELAELLYISFMEPSTERLEIEWNMSKSEIEKKLENLETHQHPEFSFLGNLYHRADVESLSPFNSLGVSSSVREASEVEVNHLD